MEQWCEIKKRSELQASPEEKPRKRGNNGSGTVNYVREKSEAELKIRKSELELKKARTLVTM